MVSVGGTQWSLETISLQTFGPDCHTVGIPVEDLGLVASSIEEEEQSSFANVAMEVREDDAVEAVEALAHVDRCAVKIDFYLGVDGEHLRDRLQDARQRVDGFERNDQNGTARKPQLKPCRGLCVKLEELATWSAGLEFSSPLVEGLDGASDGLAVLNYGLRGL